MKYDIATKDGIRRFKERFDYLCELASKKDNYIVNLTPVHKKRTNQQNRYLHLAFGLFGIETGLTTEEAKITVKRELNYTYVKDGHTFLRKTSEMDTKELTDFIDCFH